MNLPDDEMSHAVACPPSARREDRTGRGDSPAIPPGPNGAIAAARFAGRYMIHKASTKRHQHTSIEAAEAEAARLARANPDEVFIITRAVGRVKVGGGAGA